MRLRLHFDVEGITDVVASCDTHAEDEQEAVKDDEITRLKEANAGGKAKVHAKAQLVDRLTTVYVTQTCHCQAAHDDTEEE